MRIKVEYDSDILGHGLLWEGEDDEVGSIPNFPARIAAEEAIASGKTTKFGMWTVYIMES